MTLFLISLCISSIVFLSKNCQAEVTIENNGYSGIVVAFAPSIGEAQGFPLIEKIKELFTNGSRALYAATRQRAYFKQVTILVPRTWTRKIDYGDVASEMFHTATVRIDTPNPQYGDGPYTLQTMSCGQQGEYIHITPGYLENLNGTSTTLFGHPGKTLVHEWAHYRYGIFDEFGVPNSKRFKMFYIDPLTEEVRPNYCSNDLLKGPFVHVDYDNNQPCDLGLDDIPDEKCIFVPSTDSTANSSLASYHYLPEVEVFCDDDLHPHNPYAPNKHNLLCDERSTWSVIEGNEDFSNKNNPSQINSKDLIPSFNIVKQSEPVIILVLDLSSSMNADGPYTRMMMLTATVKRWIMDEVKIGWTVGIVTFSSSSQLLVAPHKMVDDRTKEKLRDKVPSTAGGGTCIGCGLRTALSAMENSGKQSGGTIILVSDGEENVSPFVSDVMGEVIKFKARVVTIAFTKESSSSLEKLAKQTGGKTFFVSIDKGIEAMASAFYEAITVQETEVDTTVKLSEKRFTKTTDKSLRGSFIIDETVGNNTKVSFSYQENDDIEDIRIEGVGNVSVSLKSQEANIDPNLQSIQFKFDYLQPGEYNYTIERKTATENQVIVTQVLSTPSTTGTKPITTRCWVAQETISQTTNVVRYIVYAEVKQGANPVIGAMVIAKVDNENGHSELLRLLDNGNGAPDITGDDGIYSRYFTKAIVKGRYTVQATVTGNDKSSIREMGFTASRSLPITTREMYKTLKEREEPTGLFERFSDGGSFKVENPSPSGDLYPPSRVTDLELIHVAPDNSYVSVQWTAPGGDLDDGNATLYDARYSANRTELRHTFNETSSPSLNTTNPLPAGEIETYTFVLPELKPKTTLYLALRTRDDSQWSATSNILEIRGLQKPSPETKKEKDLTGLIVGVVVGVIILVVVAGCIARVVIRKRHHRGI